MKNISRPILYLVIVFFQLFSVLPVSAQTNSFKFVAWGDTKSDIKTLSSLANQVKTLNPAFTIYGGDLESAGFTTVGMGIWTNAMNGGVNNGIADETFPVRGNHDDQQLGSSTNWQSYFTLSSHVQSIGGSNYSALNDDLTYSFDYGNSRFIGIDSTGNVTQITSAQIAWLDQRLTDAEAKGLTHAFLYWHGPFYYIANHVSGNPPSELINVINRHKIVSATFHGHEHSIAYTHINSTRTPGITHQFEQFVSGDAGAGPTVPTSSRVDYWMDPGSGGGFVLVNVNGNQYTVDFYKGGSTTVQYSKTFTTDGTTAQPPVSPTRTPTQGGPSPTRISTPTRPAVSPTPLGNVCTYFKN